jgi:peptidoglycan hydrolase-like protein with peptidoglycan-binding domain
MLIAVVLFSFNSLYTTKVSAAAQVVTTPKVAADVNSSCPPTQNKGANNDWVKVIQYKLNSLVNNDVLTAFPNYPLTPDGGFGPNTYGAVVSFQKQSGLTRQKEPITPLSTRYNIWSLKLHTITGSLRPLPIAAGIP